MIENACLFILFILIHQNLNNYINVKDLTKIFSTLLF